MLIQYIKKNEIYKPPSTEALEEYIHFIREKLGSNLIKRETQADFYILCPYHREETASMGIAKKTIGLCKCWGCGKAIPFSKMIAETLGIAAKKPEKVYRQKNSDQEDDDLPF
jgi:DNA primase